MAMGKIWERGLIGKRWGSPAPVQCGASSGAGLPAHMRVSIQAHIRGGSIVRTWPHSRGIGVLTGLGPSGLGSAGL